MELSDPASGAVETADWSKLPAHPTVSVYMLTYNHGPYVARAIEGVISQRCSFPFELIIGEDCSTDNTLEVVRSYQQRFPHLIRILSGAINVGAKVNSMRCRSSLRGPFVAICEGDDFWLDSCKLQLQVDLLTTMPDVSCVVHAARVVDRHGADMNRSIRPAFSSRLLSMQEMIRGSGYMIPTASIVCRREVMSHPPSWQRDAAVGDYPLMLRARLIGNVAFLNRQMAAFRVGVPGSWTERKGNSLRTNILHAMEMERILNGFNAYTRHRYSRSVNASISKYYADALVYSIGERRERRLAFIGAKSRLQAIDKMFAWLASYLGIRLTWVKTTIRKATTLTRLLVGELSSSPVISIK